MISREIRRSRPLVWRSPPLATPSAHVLLGQDFLNEHFAARWGSLPFGFNAMKCFYSYHAAFWEWGQERRLD